MHDCIVWALLKGVPSSAAPWSQTPAPAFICPVPGYDRHFAICEEYGIRVLPAPMTGQGPDMETVEALVPDSAVKAMWFRHVRFLKNEAGLRRHMDAHRALLAPKFGAVTAALESRLAGTN